MYRTYLLAAVVLFVANLAARDLQRPPRPVAQPAPPPQLVPISDPAAFATCNTDFLREIRRHPHWTLRVDATEPRECGLSPLVRDAYIVITPDGASWQRDRRERYDDQPFLGDPMPQRMELTAADRERALAALDHLCAETTEPSGRWYTEVAIDPADAPVMPVRSAALEQLFVDLQDQYVARRAPYAHDLTAHLSYREVDDRDRVTTHHIEITHHELRPAPDDTYDADDIALVDALDCLASLPEAENPVLAGTVVVGGTTLWIAAPRDAVMKATCLRRALHWMPTDRLVATPSSYPPPSDDYLAKGYAGFDTVVGVSDLAR